jgi:signal transduction histidine kinase
LKYRGKIIGVLALGSDKSNAFILQDEQLLVVIASHLAGLFENVRLNEETRQRAHNLNLIHQVVRRILGINDLNEIATLTAELMVKEFSYELASVILCFGNGKIITTRGDAGTFTLNVPTRSGEQGDIGISRLVFADGKSRLLNDVATDEAYVPVNQWIGGSEMCVPLKEGERLLGVIDVQRSRKHAFTENDLLALEALAGVVSSVVLSALRYGQLQDSVKQLQAVRETALDIAADLELNTHLLRVVQRARDLVGAKGAELGLIDEEAQILRVLVSDTPWYGHNNSEIPLWAGVAGKVAALGEPLVVDDYNTWNGRLYPERIAPFKSVAGVPLKFQGQVIGTLTIIDDRPDWTFDATHMQLLELLAPQVTVWIRNAKLYQELQERIEAQRSAENRLIRSARLAAVGEMAAGVAHELNNPLTTVAGFVELVLDELPQDSPHRPDLELVLRESHRARGVVRRLLDFSRPGENRRTRTDLNELVSDVLTLVHHLVRTSGVEMKIDLSLDLPWVSVDPAQIKQVLLNLVHNSIQSMPSGGTLLVKTARGLTGEAPDNQSWATVAITDNGEGISEVNLERVFEPFFTTRPAGKGTGLGLSVSYGIITDHDGFIEVDSQIGKGSCFTVFLPLGEDNPHDR